MRIRQATCSTQDAMRDCVQPKEPPCTGRFRFRWKILDTRAVWMRRLEFSNPFATKGFLTEEVS